MCKKYWFLSFCFTVFNMIAACFFAAAPTFATSCAGVETSIISCDDSSAGGAIFSILATVLNILTAGVGIAATAGLVIAGFQYLTARDDSGQITKAKNRILQISIGLAIYSVSYVLIGFLLPGGPEQLISESAEIAANTPVISKPASTPASTPTSNTDTGAAMSATTANRNVKTVVPPADDSREANVAYAMQFLDQFIIDANHFYGKSYKLPSALLKDGQATYGATTVSFATPSDLNKPEFKDSLKGDLLSFQDKYSLYGDIARWNGLGRSGHLDVIMYHYSCFGGESCGQCVAVSGWFIYMMTQYDFGSSNGYGVVDSTIAANGGKLSKLTTPPTANHVFLFSEPASANNNAYGHTGVILKRNNDGTYLTIEGGGGRVAIYLARTFASGVSYIDLSSGLKIDEHLGRTY